MSTPESPVQKSRGRHRSNRNGSPVHVGSHQIATPPHHNHYHHSTHQQGNNSQQTPPQSPSKIQQQVQSPESVMVMASASKKKRRAKPKPKDVNTSHLQTTHQDYESSALSSSNDESSGGQSSPTHGVLNTPTKAYAGPNFHSSPAPSSLPLPSWLSKSVPGTPSAGSSLQAMLEMTGEEPISTLSQSLEESESHLEKLFRAHKEEKARQGRLNFGETPKPALATLANASPQKEPESPVQPRRKSPDIASSGLFSMDMGGVKLPSSSSLDDPIFGTPTKPAAKQTSVDEARKQADALMSFLNQPLPSPITTAPKPVQQATPQGTPTRLPSNNNYRRNQYSESAPRFSGQTSTSSPPPPFPAQNLRNSGRQHNSERQLRITPTPPKARRNYSLYTTPSTPSPKREQNSFASPTYVGRKGLETDSVMPLAEMEEYLRRVLKLEAAALATPAVAS